MPIFLEELVAAWVTDAGGAVCPVTVMSDYLARRVDGTGGYDPLANFGLVVRQRGR